MDDSAFLHWVADRLVRFHGDHPRADFVLKLRSIAEAQPKGQHTPNTYNYPENIEDGAVCKDRG